MRYTPPDIASLTILPDDVKFAQKLQLKIDQKTKPLGALGQLETLAHRLGRIQKRDVITFTSPQMLVFAADHGITAEGVSAFPQSVTQQMVANMLAGGAAVNVFARQHGFAVTVVDAGVAGELPSHPQLQKRKMAMGTGNACVAAAMSAQQGIDAVNAGMEVVRGLPGNVLALGEMGIGNTSSAALIFSLLTQVPIDEAAGRGTGLDDVQMQTKLAALRKALAKTPMDVLCAVGGFEIAMMVGAMLQAASERRVVLVDGFIASTAALLASTMAPHALDYMVFCHVGAEHGHRALLARMGARPLLALGLRLGEGTGALLAWPLVMSAAKFVNEMASFASAGVDERGA
jgi:nicotinate-nucleotide--dimethylbenzimidazole phosphoribosyltransferase